MSLEIISNVEGAMEGALSGARKALLQTAIRVTAQAKAFAPVREGELKNSIMWIVGNQESSFLGPRLVHATLDRFGKITGVVGTAVEHGLYQEFGTRFFPGGNPYLRPAILVVTGAGAYRGFVKDIMFIQMSNSIKNKSRRYNV